ncbi:MAG: hypothetical protein M3083_19765 [Actinomycetota bacterium]|nr:hypothetical protein [Actinomycetota bacterium]
MMDNSVGGVGQGTAHLQTVCKQGQALNWLVYPMEMDKRPDGTWPPMPRITNIVFLDNEGSDRNVSPTKVCPQPKIYGGPDLIRSPYTPVYYYWAGRVVSQLKPGIYHYRLVFELEREGRNEKLYLNTVEEPSIRVLKVER